MVHQRVFDVGGLDTFPGTVWLQKSVDGVLANTTRVPATSGDHPDRRKRRLPTLQHHHPRLLLPTVNVLDAMNDGVSAWHGCPRRHLSTSPQTTPPPPPPSPSVPTSPLAPRVAALQSAVEKLKAVSASFESRMDALEASINDLKASHAFVEATVGTLTETQHTMIKKLSTLTERFESWAMHTTSGPVGRFTPPRAAAAATAASSTTGLRSRHPKDLH